MSEKAPTSSNKESYADSLRNRVGNYRTDGAVLDESERLARKLSASPEVVEAEVVRDFAEGDALLAKSASKDPKVKGTEKEFVVKSISEDTNGEKIAIILSKDGKEEQIIPYSALQRNAVEVPAPLESDDSAPTEAAVASKSSLRPVADGEFGDDYLGREENSDPEHPDYLPVGAMAHEPWTFADEADADVATGNNDPTNNPGDDAEVPTDVTETPTGEVVVDDGNQPGTDIELVSDGSNTGSERPSGVYGRKGEDLFGGGRETPGVANPETPLDLSGDQHPEYDGPVEPGSEIELAGPTDIEHVPTPGEIQQRPEVDPAFVERLDLARSRYAEMTAKSRKSYLGRFLKNDTKVGGILAKIPGVSKAVDVWNAAKQKVSGKSEKADALFFEKDVLEAKAEYEEAYNALSDATKAELERVGFDAESITWLSTVGNIGQDSRLESEIAAQREAQSGKTNTFVNFWVNQKGFKGKLLKGVIVLGAGGLTAGIFAGAAAAYVAGGAAGFGIAKHVTGRRANAVDAEGRTLARTQSFEDHRQKHADITAAHNANGAGSVEDITKTVESRTDEEVLGNRRRMRTAVAIGSLGGRAAFGAKNLLDNIFDKPKKTPDAPKPEPAPDAPKPPRPEEPTATPPEAPKPPTPEEINGRMFNVESGNGFTHEIQDFAQANGTQVDGQKAFDIYNEAIAKFGENGLIEPTGTYARSAGDFGISSPGGAAWKPGVAEFLKARL